MKHTFLIAITVIINTTLNAQKPGYYNGTENKKGEELKTALHNIIKAHVDFSYSDAKYIINYADEDPDNTNNLIQFYTNRSVNKNNYGTGGNQTNREHVWAKSHGNFADLRPMDGDAHNLHPADASVNIIRSNYDFDSVPDGTYVEEADAYYGGGAFEPADRDKGAVARTLFYMAVRYEGTNGELDLKMADRINTANDESDHGKLSTLLKWNRNFPPTELEIRRNERVFKSQLNRNPFIDHPEFADLIWSDAELNEIYIGNMAMNPVNPVAGETVEISATISGTETLPTVKLYWGKSYNSEAYETDFSGARNITATLSLENFSDNEIVFLKAVASSGEKIHSTFTIAPSVDLTDISAIQGTSNSSPMQNSIVTIAGIVTANFDNSFYMQTGNAIRSGICIYSSWRGRIGDSVVVTGKVVEYQNLTELSNVTMVYNYGQKKIITPLELMATELKEDYEGMLVKLTDVNFSNADELITANGGTYTINDGANSISVYVRYGSRLTGHRIPNGTIDVTAVLSQFNDTYQLLIDNMGWIEQGVDTTAPIITTVTATDNNYIEVSFNEKIKESSVSTSAFHIDGLTIDGAYCYPSTKAFLLVNGLQKKEYTLIVNGIEDLFGNITTNATFTFISDFGTGIDNKSQQPFNLYPNPNSGNFTLAFNKNLKGAATVKLFDIYGRVVYKKLINERINKHNISLNKAIAKGCYFLQVINNGNTYTQKIVVD